MNQEAFNIESKRLDIETTKRIDSVENYLTTAAMYDKAGDKPACKHYMDKAIVQLQETLMFLHAQSVLTECIVCTNLVMENKKSILLEEMLGTAAKCESMLVTMQNA